MEEEEEIPYAYKKQSYETETCSDAGKYRIFNVFLEKKLHWGIITELERIKIESKDNFPIMYRQVKENTLFFNSRFESGNLREVEKVNDLEYNLYLNFDFNTLNYT